MRMEVIIAIILTVAATITVPVFAWFTNYKKLGDLERIDTPTTSARLAAWQPCCRSRASKA